MRVMLVRSAAELRVVPERRLGPLDRVHQDELAALRGLERVPEAVAPLGPVRGARWCRSTSLPTFEAIQRAARS